MSAFEDFQWIHLNRTYEVHYSASHVSQREHPISFLIICNDQALFLPWHRYLLHTYEQQLVACGYTGTSAHSSPTHPIHQSQLVTCFPSILTLSRIPQVLCPTGNGVSILKETLPTRPSSTGQTLPSAATAITSPTMATTSPSGLASTQLPNTLLATVVAALLRVPLEAKKSHSVRCC